MKAMFTTTMRSGFIAALLCVAAASASAYASITIDLSYVDRKSESYQRFKRWVDSAVNGKPGYAFSAVDAVTMFKLSSQARYCELAVRMTADQVNAADAKIAAGQKPDVAGDSYLEAGPMISALAVTYDVCRAQTSDAQRRQWAAYAEQTISNIWNPRTAMWGQQAFEWTGWSTDNPGNNYYYSFVEATMYWALASNSEKWLALLRDDKLPALQKYFARLPGGGSLEGTGYGTAQMRLFAIYRVWRDSTGIDLANANRHLSDSIYYWINATVPTFDRFAPFGDQARVSVPELFDYHRRLMLEARQLSKDEKARAAASWWLQRISVQHMSHGFNYRYDLLPAGDHRSPPDMLVYHATGTGHLFARTSWDSKASWVAFSAGPYLESHAHQDQGSFTLFSHDWLAVTENIWTRSGIQQGTNVHNVVRFERNGTVIGQREPSESTMTVNSIGTHGEIDASANLTPAYPTDAGIRSWQREIHFADRKLRVRDRVATAADVTAIFQINVPVKPVLNGREATAGRLHIKVLAPADATLKTIDWMQADKDFRSGWRIDVSGSGDEFLVELIDPAATP
jgi:hypothetical protein